MKVALEVTGKIGSRAARVLLAEKSLDRLGLIGRRSTTGDPRVSTITNLAGWDVLVTDNTDQYERRYRQASDHGIPFVVANGEPPVTLEADIPIVLGANPRVGLVTAIADHECSQHDNLLEVVIGWTEPGRPLRRGYPLVFPKPIGNLWAQEGAGLWPGAPPGTRFWAAPVEGTWTGLVARVTAATPDGVQVRTLGVADDDAYLAGIALAAAARAAGTGEYPVGIHYPTAATEVYLEAAQRAGLAIATFTDRR